MNITNALRNKRYNRQLDKLINRQFFPLLEGIKSGDSYVPKKLPKELKKEYIDYYASFGFKNVPTDWIEYVYSIKGDFDVRYIPDTIQNKYIDISFPTRFCEVEDKNYQPIILQDLVKYPKTIVGNINGTYINGKGELIDELHALSEIAKYEQVVIKPSIGGSGGKNVEFYTNTDEIMKDIHNVYIKDFVIQERVEQGTVMSELNDSSINTVRLLSYYYRGEVFVAAPIVRIGAPGSIVDNGSGRKDHYHVGIRPNGKLEKYGYNVFLEKSKHTHGGKPYSDYTIEQYPEMVNIAKEAHYRMTRHKMIAWDFAVNKDDEIVLIEYNFKNHMLAYYYSVSGPIYGDNTEGILKEAAENKRQGKHIYDTRLY